MATKKVFLDTNIVLDMIDKSRKNHSIALSLGEYLVVNGYNIYISEDMLTTIFYIAKDKYETLTFIKEVISIDWEIVPFGKDVINEAVKLSLENHLDLEDVLQCLCAKENDCEAIITNDKDFFDCEINILSIEEFL